MNTIQAHYDALRQSDLESYLAMNGKLASRLHMKADCLTYFKRSILEKEAKPEAKIDLAVLPGWIQKQFVDYLGFTWEGIFSNKIPPISKQ